MRNFTVIQNVLTAIVIPFLAVIVGISSIPAIYLFLYFGVGRSKKLPHFRKLSPCLCWISCLSEWD